jgi:hypothetical protein
MDNQIFWIRWWDHNGVCKFPNVILHQHQYDSPSKDYSWKLRPTYPQITNLMFCNQLKIQIPLPRFVVSCPDPCLKLPGAAHSFLLLPGATHNFLLLPICFSGLPESLLGTAPTIYAHCRDLCGLLDDCPFPRRLLAAPVGWLVGRRLPATLVGQLLCWPVAGYPSRHFSDCAFFLPTRPYHLLRLFSSLVRYHNPHDWLSLNFHVSTL